MVSTGLDFPSSPVPSTSPEPPLRAAPHGNPIKLGGGSGPMAQRSRPSVWLRRGRPRVWFTRSSNLSDDTAANWGPEWTVSGQLSSRSDWADVGRSSSRRHWRSLSTVQFVADGLGRCFSAVRANRAGAPRTTGSAPCSRLPSPAPRRNTSSNMPTSPLWMPNTLTSGATLPR